MSMSLFSALRDRPDEISEKERRMAAVTERFRDVASEVGDVLAQAESLVERLKDVRQEIETVQLLEVVREAQEEDTENCA
jgi:DNA repair ATPase RecN